jgi:DNA mismatch repair protein MutS2
MYDQAFATLEYDQLRALIQRGAQTPMGRARVESLAPLTDPQTLLLDLKRLAECVELRKRRAIWSFRELSDPGESIARLHIEGAPLETLAILDLARLCESAMLARAAILAEREVVPILWEIVAELPRDLNSLVARIKNKILPGGELDDRASPELARIRHEIARLRSSITRSLEGLMRRSEEAIQDELVTVRNDRFVIPVKADHRGRLQGVAHGFSSSGATVFVEPIETIEANNELQALRETELQEISRILLALSAELRNQLPAIELAANAIAELDFIGAKAAFFNRFNCVVPKIAESANAGSADILSASTHAGGILKFKDARHPLLEENLRSSGTTVVPVSFSLNESNTTMVISGANAGGKTVVLKTAGLLALMALSGLPVPALEACVPFYHSVLADIGDHQSLAANLSTFTSHVANISRMIELCEAPALVLLDEVGTGTDPEEGSALGVAVVDHFRRACGAHVMATTHYSGLKMYAANEAGVLNASVEFDEQTLQPTYKLMVGLAGSSSGLEIARRFGISNQIVQSAAQQVSDSSRNATEYLRRIKREAEEAIVFRQALEEERTAVAEKFASLDKQFQRRERERQLGFERALQETVAEFEKRSRELFSKIQDRAERLKVEREAQKQSAELKRDAKRAVSAAAQVRSSTARVTQTRGVRVLRDGKLLESTNPSPARADGSGEPDFVSEDRSLRNEGGQDTRVLGRAPRVGDRVRLLSFGSIGIVDQVKGDEAEVRVKSLRFREKLENLELVETAMAPAESGRAAKLRVSSGTEFKPAASSEPTRSELNVIGQTTDKAVDAVDKFLDEAFLNSLGEIRIIHGHGTGALRRAIGELLEGHPHVAGFVAAPPDQGGAGATVVELKG